MTNEPMSREKRARNARVFEIADKVAVVDDADRDDKLDELCGGDPSLIEEVRLLLDAADNCDERAVERSGDTADWGSRAAGQRIGRYRLLQCIGEGGFGEVWMAEQVEPVKRRVAVKLIKPGMDSSQVIARFEAERQALALMDHPNIARVFDAGTTPEGRLYFVMELVKGVPITEYCHDANLDLRDRVVLMSEVCRAVQHAHQKGVIHRDLKPANVLVGDVDGRPVPKVIDFGVAKALERPLTDRTLFTEFRQFVGTPEYMSPEQADLSMIDVDTRSDVYALGVLLYELLSGSTPFETEALRSAGFDEMRRIIREDVPPSPSVRLYRSRSNSSAARHRVPENLAKQSRLIRGELDWIVQKAMAKERDRRYATSNDMADDLGRYLNNQPVEAGPLSVLYRTKRFIRRHRAGAAIAAVFVLAFAGFVGLVIWDNARVHAAELVAIARADEAERERAVTAAINTFLNEDLLAAAIPSIDYGRGHEVTMRTVVDVAAEKVGDRFPDQPVVEADIRSTLGRTYLALGILDSAEENLREAVVLNQRGRGPDDPLTLGSIDELTMALIALYKFEEAEANLRKLIAFREKKFGVDGLMTLKTMEGLGVVVKRLGRYQEAERYYLAALEGKKRGQGPTHEDTLLTRDNLAKLYIAQGRFEDAEAMLKDTIVTRTRFFDGEHPRTLDSRRSYANCLRGLGRFEESERLCSQLEEPYQRVYGPHFATYVLKSEHALTLSEMGRVQEALELMTEAVEGMSALRDPNHTVLRVSQVELALLQARVGRTEEAEEMAALAVESLTGTLGREHPTTLSMRSRYAEVLRLQDRADEAEALLRENVMLQRHVLGADHPETRRSTIALEQLANAGS